MGGSDSAAGAGGVGQAGGGAGGIGDAGGPDTTTYYLSDIAWLLGTNDWGPIEKDTSNGEYLAGDGHPLTIAGTTYPKGLGANASSILVYQLDGACTSFTADVGIDNEVAVNGSVIFHVLVDGKPVYTSARKTGGQSAERVAVDITGARSLLLYADDDGSFSYDHADWADAKIVCKTGMPLGDGGQRIDGGPKDASTAGTTPFYLSDLSWSFAVNEWGPVERDMSNGDTAAGDGKPITINGVMYAKGLGINATSFIVYKLNGSCSTFTADVGIDAEAGTSGGSVKFRVLVDGDPVFASQEKRVDQSAEHVAVDLTGARMLALYADDVGSSYADHADWAAARVFCSMAP
jgi:alpha-galactosidase